MSGVGAKANKERERLVQEKVQAILGGMLREEDNKYCVDCDSKGPRWASWNLGVFLCIRCAGIHRNLGVHISKVKSVNLDSWTPQQVSSMQIMGNSKARSVYEANLPEDFKRPGTDSAVESFVRQKYEKKKFIMADWSPTKPPDTPRGWDEAGSGEQSAKNKPEVANSKKIVLLTPPNTGASPKVEKSVIKTTLSAPKPAVSLPGTPGVVSVGPTEDLLGLSFPPTTSQTQPPIVPTTSSTINTNSSAASDLLGLSDFSDFVSAQPSPQTTSNSASLDFSTFQSPATTKAEDSSSAGGKMSTDSIMALFGSRPAASKQQPQVPQQHAVFTSPAAGGQAQQMFPQSNSMFAANPSPAQAACGLVSNPFLDQMGSFNQPSQPPVGINNMNGQFGGLNLGTNQALDLPNISGLGLWP